MGERTEPVRWGRQCGGTWYEELTAAEEDERCFWVQDGDTGRWFWGDAGGWGPGWWYRAASGESWLVAEPSWQEEWGWDWRRHPLVDLASIGGGILWWWQVTDVASQRNVRAYES